MPTKKRTTPRNHAANNSNTPSYKQGAELGDRMLQECPPEDWHLAIEGFRDRVAGIIKDRRAKSETHLEQLESAYNAATR